jgi:hypothetical protein
LFPRDINLLQKQTSAWVDLLSRKEVTLGCYCKPGEFCHRYLLAQVLVDKFGAVYRGERTPGGIMKADLQAIVPQYAQVLAQKAMQDASVVVEPERGKAVVVGGAASLRAIPSQAQQSLDRIIQQRMPVLIGDEPEGVSALVQDYLHRRGYRHVTVYHVGDKPNLNLGNWPTAKVPGNDLRQRDSVMAQNAEYALLIFDKGAPGTNQLAQFFLAKEQKEKRKLTRLFESE